MGGWNKKNEIEKKKLILTEGNDALEFCICALEAYGVEDVQVMDFGENEQLKDFLSLLKYFPDIEKILIIRDTGIDSDAAQYKIKSDLINAGYYAPQEAFVFGGSRPEIAYALFSSIESNGSLKYGSLEDLCLSTLETDPIMEHVNSMATFFIEDGISILYPHKTKLHAYLAFKDPFVGLKLGEAAKAKAFDWNHPSMSKFNKIITDLT
ncbi:hypothetical protein COL08_27885 [Priestia megaterium]|uniref:DUF3226 domain-containing protein n=1 Tax=Priestia megaterium TaxID=1404 RepID=UPI000BF6A57B|nr:DUF3226 domain-containing protein [Priestia megaterium]PFV89685.1 hypothetical protein COL08_27885 [Priestia megaterium]